jgi:20S proteasome subunit alpha 7
MGAYTQAFTLHSGVRPFGITAIIGGWDSEKDHQVDGQVGFGPKVGSGGRQSDGNRGGPFLYMIEPSGLYWVCFASPTTTHAGRTISHNEQGYYGAATGKGRQSAKSELEKLDLASGSLTLEQGVKEAARIIYVAHEDSKDKEFELEMTWISAVDGPTKGRHVEVPRHLREEAERLAKKALEDDDDEEEEKGAAAGGEERMEE